MIPRLSRSSHIVSFGRHPDRFLLLDGARVRWTMVNASGLEILGQCNGNRSLAQIAGTLAARHAMPLDEAQEGTGGFLNHMMKAGLVFDAEEQPAVVKVPQTKFGGITVEITRRCNLRCRHCYLAAGEEQGGELSFDEIKCLSSAAAELGATFVNLSGGEPLLRPDCFALLRHIEQLHLQCTIGTNGTTISPQVAEQLAALPVVVQVSLDGATSATHDAMRGSGVFQRTLQGLDNLLQAGLAKRVTLSFTPTALNADDLPGVIDLAVDKGLRKLTVNSLVAGGNAQLNWDHLELSVERELEIRELVYARSLELSGRLEIAHQGLLLNLDGPGISRALCATGTNLRITPEGHIYPCQCFAGGEDYRLGDIRQQTLEEIVLGSRLQQVKQNCYERIERIEQCQACHWRHFCGAGCMGNAYHRYGTILHASDCDLSRAWIERLFELRFDGMRDA